MIYEPSEDSFLILKYVVKYCKGKNVLDVGCGNGVLAEAALKKGAKDVICCDINPLAVESVQKKRIKAVVSDLFSDILGKFDLIVFNPPYLPFNKDEDKESSICTSGGEAGYEIIERFLIDAKAHLKKDGKILIVFSSLTGDIDVILKREGYKFKCLEKKKLFFEELKVYLITS